MRVLSSVLVVLPMIACAAEAAPEEATTAAETNLASDGGTDGGTDGPPSHEPCTSRLGSGLVAGSHGRLDGYLVAVVPSGAHECHGDRDHVHLQIRMGGQVYDVAVNVDGVKTAEIEAPLVDGAWSEGWHASAPLDYARDLRVHTGSFQRVSASALEDQLTSELADANHISVFATKYNRSGVHLVHRSRSAGSLDGAVVLYPTTGTPRYFLFQFPDQSF